MRPELEQYYNAVKSYMNLIWFTPIFHGSVCNSYNLEKLEQLLSDLLIEDVDVSYYDGILWSGVCCGLNIASAWCMYQHSMSDNNLPYMVVINEGTSSEHHPEYEDHTQYSVFDEGDLTNIELDDDWLQFQTKIIELCKYYDQKAVKWGYADLKNYPRLYLKRTYND